MAPSLLAAEPCVLLPEPVVRDLLWPTREGGGFVFNFALLEDFGCPLCEDFGIVEVSVKPALGLVSETHEAETEWRVCECRKGEALAEMSGRP